MNRERLIEIAVDLINYISEELVEEDNAKWFENMFGITKDELKELGVI